MQSKISEDFLIEVFDKTFDLSNGGDIMNEESLHRLIDMADFLRVGISSVNRLYAQTKDGGSPFSRTDIIAHIALKVRNRLKVTYALLLKAISDISFAIEPDSEDEDSLKFLLETEDIVGGESEWIL